MTYYNCIIRHSTDSKEDEVTIKVNRHQRRNIIYELQNMIDKLEPYEEIEEEKTLFSRKEVINTTIYEGNKLIWLDDLDTFLNLDNVSSIRFEKIEKI